MKIKCSIIKINFEIKLGIFINCLQNGENSTLYSIEFLVLIFELMPPEYS